jgi:hypothetical protein
VIAVPTPRSAPLLVDVGHDGGDDAGDEDSLAETPEDKSAETLRSGCQKRRQREPEDRGNDDLLAPDVFGGHSNEWSENGRGQRGSADGEADFHFAGGVNVTQVWQQRLGSVDVEECGDARRASARRC